MGKVSLSILVPTRNEVENLTRTLPTMVEWADEVVLVDSDSHDGTIELARRVGAEVISFHYSGGWPKKRQWALETYPFRNPWVLLLDADELLTPELQQEIEAILNRDDVQGAYIPLDLVFLGRRLRHGGFRFYKLSLFRVGAGNFEKRIEDQTTEMSDVEVHEHVHVQGNTIRLRGALEHHNVNSLFRYIHKHNEYSTWEAEVMYRTRFGPPLTDEIPARWWGGSQAQKRRWLKNMVFYLPGFSLLAFVYHYFFRGGFRDGQAGLVYCLFQAIQRFHTKVKYLELVQKRRCSHENATLDNQQIKPVTTVKQSPGKRILEEEVCHASNEYPPS